MNRKTVTDAIRILAARRARIATNAAAAYRGETGRGATAQLRRYLLSKR